MRARWWTARYWGDVHGMAAPRTFMACMVVQAALCVFAVVMAVRAVAGGVW